MRSRSKEIRHVQALYAGEVTLVDRWVGVLLDKIRDLGIWDSTLIVHLSDHGEPLGRTGWGHGIIRKASPWPYEELIHIPLMIRHPKGIGAGKRFAAFVETCDIMPTILDFLGVQFPPLFHGRNLLPIMDGSSDRIREEAYSGFYLKSWAIRRENWKYILWLPKRPEVKIFPRVNSGCPTTTFRENRYPKIVQNEIIV